MKPQDEAVELWRYMEKRGLQPSARRVAAALRAMKITCDDHLVRKWLAPFRTAVNRSATAAATAQQEHEPPQNAPQVHPRLRAPKLEPLVPIASEPTVLQPRQPKLRLVPEGEETARAILTTLWPVIAPRLAGRQTQKDWKARNKRAALAMAQAGVTVEAAIAVHAELCEERGDTIYTLAWVHERIMRGPSAPTKRRANGCDCNESDFDCERLHSDDGSPEWVIVGKGTPEEQARWESA